MSTVRVLLDPIRDKVYFQSLINPTSTAPDAGVGAVDNIFFFDAGHYSGGILNSGVQTVNDRRLFLCWFGSPAGTNSVSPKYSLFCARVNEEAFDLDKPAPQWLDPPFLLLSYDQLSADIINWFDNVMAANGITASNGVATVSSMTYVSGYGYIAGTVNMTGTPELKQLHFVYDPLDDTVLMYLSMMTPNWTSYQKTIYVYKFPVSILEQGNSINGYTVNGLTLTTTSTPPPADKPYFLGGFKLPDNIEQLMEGAIKFNWNNTVHWQAYPQFTISFDYMKLGELFGYDLSKGYLPAIFVGTAGGSVELDYPHGNALFSVALSDIHNNPAQPSVLYVPLLHTVYFYTLNPGQVNCASSNSYFYCIPVIGWAGNLDMSSYGIVVDKFGSIIPGESFGVQNSFIIPVSTPSASGYSTSSFRMKVLYVAPIGSQYQGYFGLGFAWTDSSVINPDLPFSGLSRPYVHVLKGKKFVTFGGYYYDKYVNGVAVEINENDLSPKGKTLITVPSLVVGQKSPGGSYYIAANSNPSITAYTGVVAWTFGKKYARLTNNSMASYKLMVTNSSPSGGVLEVTD